MKIFYINNILNMLKGIMVTLSLALFYLLVLYTDFNWYSESLSYVYCQGEDDLSNTNNLKDTLESVKILSKNGMNHNINIGLNPSTKGIVSTIAGALSGSVSVYAGSQAASYIPHPVGKVATFIGTFAVSMGLQRTFASSFNNASLSNKNNDKIKTHSVIDDLDEALDRTSTKFPSTDLTNFINSPLEGYTDLNMLVIGMLIVNLGALLLMILILINFTIKLFNLESKEFVISRPRLHRFITLSLKSRDYTSLFIMVIVLFGLCSIFYGLSYLLYFMKLINI